MSRCFISCLLPALCLVLGMAKPAFAQTVILDPILSDIADYAVAICGEFERTGGVDNDEFSASATIKANGLFSRIVDAGVEVEGGKDTREYVNVLQTELLQDLKSIRECRERVSNDMANRLIIPPNSDSNGPVQPVRVSECTAKNNYFGVFIAERCVSLATVELDLPNGYVGDPSNLARLTTLAALDAGSTDLDDLTALSRLEFLQVLWIDRTFVEDLGPLASLPRLRELDISDTVINDLSPLAGMKRLQVVELSDSFVNDISALSSSNRLTELNIKNTDVHSLALIDGFRNLTKITANGSQIRSLNDLQRGLPRLAQLFLSGAPLSPDFSLRCCPNLAALSLDSDDLRDVRFLRDVPKLRSLVLGGTGIDDIAPIAELESLQYLDLSRLSPNVRLRPLRNHRGLTHLIAPDGTVVVPSNFRASASGDAAKAERNQLIRAYISNLR